jgi:putative membrane protein
LLHGAVSALTEVTIMHNSKLALTLTVSLSLGSFACSSDRPARSASSGYEPAMTPAARSAPSAPNQLGSEASERLDDAQIITVLRAVNVAEVDQAKIAVGKAREASVKRFAETMIAHHGQAVREIDELDARLGLTPTESQLVQELRVTATGVENRLSDTNDASFDKAYMQSQLDMHRTALDTIDSRLTPSATREPVKQLIEGMRPKVANHLQLAQTILSMLQ